MESAWFHLELTEESKKLFGGSKVGRATLRLLRQSVVGKREKRTENTYRACESLPETGQCGESACKEDCTTTTEPVVKRDREPAADKSAAEVGGRVY